MGEDRSLPARDTLTPRFLAYSSEGTKAFDPECLHRVIAAIDKESVSGPSAR